MKNLTILFLTLCSWAAQAQLTTYTAATMNDFYGIGGYSFTEGNFPTSSNLGSPYTRSGPLPNNDFTFVATSPAGLLGVQGKLRTISSNQAITLTFKGNNVRKMRAFVRPEDANGTPLNGVSITATATTNLGNSTPVSLVYSVTNGSVGFRVQSENEYITQVVFSAPSNSSYSTTLGNIMIGDDTPQNVSLNFDGDNDYVALPSTVGNFASNATFTVSCWVKPAITQSDLTNTDVEILEKWNGSGTAYPFVIRYLNENNANGANVGKIVAGRYNGIAAPSIMSSVSIDDNKWHHIAFVTDVQGIKLYIDGVLSASGNDFTPQQANTPCTNNSPLYVGSRNTINHFKGEIDEVRLWTVGKTATEIANERFCKTPNPTSLQAAYNFNNGVPNGNNFLLIQIQDAVGTNHGSLSGFAQTGDASNWVTGQVKYVNFSNQPDPHPGSSWVNGYPYLQNALTANACNDLFDVYVSAGSDSPDKPNYVGDINRTFIIPAGMKIYGGFAATEKNINERNMALIHSTNKTTLSGDLGQNDTPFNFASNRTDNSYVVVEINGGVTFDGFTVRGGQDYSVYKRNFANAIISNCRMVDNDTGLYLFAANTTVSNCLVAGNNNNGITLFNSSTNFQNSVIVNNGERGINNQVGSQNPQSSFTNCTIASNGTIGIYNDQLFDGSITNTIKNTIIKDNLSGGIANTGFGNITNTITYSLVQGVTTGTGNLNGNTVNPQFVSPLANTVKSDAGNYHLRTNSPCLDVGTNGGIAPLDLDRNIRPQVGITLASGGTADMGAYEGAEFIKSITSGLWHVASTWSYNRIPLNTDKVIIDNSHTVTVSTTDNTSQANAVEFKSGARILYQALGRLKLGL